MSFWDDLRQLLRRMRGQPALQAESEQPPEEDDWVYPGAGLFYRCQTCGAVHEIRPTDDFVDKTRQCCERIGASTQDIYHAFQIHEDGGRWDIAPQESTFVFTRETGEKCFADYGLIGSWNPWTSSWLWAWHMPEAFQSDRPHGIELTVVRKLRERGTALGWKALTEPFLYLSEHDSWHMADLAADLEGWPMVYRAKVSDKNYHYFAISRPVQAS